MILRLLIGALVALFLVMWVRAVLGVLSGDRISLE